MANYYASFRTSYFKPNNKTLLKAWVHSWSADLEFWENTGDKELVGLGGGEEGIPGCRYDGDDVIDADFLEELQGHIADGHAAIVVEAGAEKLRYISTYVFLVTPSKITTFSPQLDAYKQAKQNGCIVSWPEY